MNDQALLSLITARADEDTIRNVVSEIEIKGGLQRGTIYLIIFKDLKAVSRRVYNQLNSETKELDVPISIGRISKDKFDLKGWPQEQVDMMKDEQVAIFICCAGEDCFAPLIAGVFDL